MTKTLKSSLIILVSLSLFSACTQEQSQDKSSTGKITFAAHSGDVGSLVYVAEEQGYFRDSGLDVTFKSYEAGKLATDALLTGKADISVGSDFVFASNSFDNPDLRIFGTISVAQDCKLIARKDHGINKPEDLKGKKIGITKKSSGEFYLGRFLTFLNLSITDVEIFDLKPSEIIEAITKGDIDAALTWEPYIYNIRKKLGENVIIWPGQSGQDFYFLLITKKDWLKSHTLEVERLLKVSGIARDVFSIFPISSKKSCQVIIGSEKYGFNHFYVISFATGMLTLKRFCVVVKALIINFFQKNFFLPYA